MNKYTPVKNFLIEHTKLAPVSFHMPGHKGSALYRKFGYSDFLENFFDCDVTEITGADNLFQAEGILKEVQDSYSRLYDSRKSYMLINGSSSGIIAAVLASVSKGHKLIMARNCHKSVFNALSLAGISPVYAYPDILDDFGVSGAIPPSEIELHLSIHPDADAVILPSPNYYGICSDIEAIADVVHKYNKILIVDQAHGAHLKIFSRYGITELPKSAEESGADIVINSTHKTLGSMTQTAVLNLNSDRVSSFVLEDKLQCIESTSPSYVLMASLDINAGILKEHGEELMHQWFDNLYYFYSRAGKIPGLDLIDRAERLDWTKINFSFRKLGLSGYNLEQQLLVRNIFIELYTGDLVMAMTGVGNTRSDFDELLRALNEISKDNYYKNSGSGIIGKGSAFKSNRSHITRAEIYDIPEKAENVALLEAEGLICKSSIIPYPPGIPLVCPGEKFDKETLLYIRDLRKHGEKVIGVNSAGEVLAGIL
ncbi:MAG: DegT/DnrJ/EryC1/StrS family aminotransferase [Spirochaetales bacterium]|uniref:DegT/DnrJ/EryC1/StrS family aminotransferase n=1 Tax=Candidatus Thalassospirochaeta sargassi TaxID=3119039 RepID=A0AAJ1IK95_9SPIO|nr:DegT/DnrJ/EryC1/StrS family aminotransferase [Spirochaetales bacterium]